MSVDQGTLKEAFQFFDKDCDGRPLSNEDARKFMTGGSMDLSAFQSLISSTGKNNFTDRQLRDAFDAFDGDQDGRIDLDHLKHALLTLADKMKEDEIEKMLDDVIVDDDGFITFEDFMRMLTGS
ncbi:hypothetical protein GJ496_008329 [Pomphorhynchus laevis]|nr:hypothetical protein GJ496_008329 [Pomphorhynchus laevis]